MGLTGRQGMRDEKVRDRAEMGLASGPVAKTARSQCKGPGLIPGQGTRSRVL